LSFRLFRRKLYQTHSGFDTGRRLEGVMVIGCERYLDDTSRYHVSLALETRTLEMHGLLTGLPPETRELVTDALVRALDEIHGLLAPLAQGAPPKVETSSFGCGT
jgi:hypothetical protein